eukprot:TRINITY_DN9728_c0_g1_i2.p1 TRINITY_DN9728_c0_g1~~TRINITY_DN9728_c0_g1_i2.p1  ORF type:complete len:233 (+),score=43.32 TRINITY_DN9728_c0_g1_i2:59-700(+)
MSAVCVRPAAAVFATLLAVTARSSFGVSASVGNASEDCSGLEDSINDCSVRIRDRASNGFDYCSVEFDRQSCTESCCRLGNCEVEADFWHDCEVRIEDRDRSGQDYCSVSFDRLGCMRSCCFRLGTTTTSTPAACDSLADIQQDCEVRIRDRFYNKQDYCAVPLDRESCLQSCCMKLGIPVIFNITIEDEPHAFLQRMGDMCTLWLGRRKDLE